MIIGHNFVRKKRLSWFNKTNVELIKLSLFFFWEKKTDSNAVVAIIQTGFSFTDLFFISRDTRDYYSVQYYVKNEGVLLRHKKNHTKEPQL